MKSREEKEKDRSAREWLTRPLYNIMLLALVVLELLREEIDAGIHHAFHVVLWIALGSVILLHTIAFFIRNTEKGGSEPEDEKEEE